MTRRDLDNIFSIFANKERFEMLLLLHKHNNLTFKEFKTLIVAKKLKKTNYQQCGTFAYNLSQIKQFKLIALNERTRLYELSCIGKEALDLAIQLTKILRHIEDTEEYDDLPACLKLLPPIYVSQRKRKK